MSPNARRKMFWFSKVIAMAVIVLEEPFHLSASTWVTTFVGTNDNWSITNNWSGSVPNGTGAVADFSTSIPVPGLTVTNDAPHTVGNLIFGNPSGTGPFWLLTGVGSNYLTLAASAGSPTDTVNNVQEFIGGLAGVQGFVKNGNGALALYGDSYSNIISGPIVVNAGLLGTVDGKAFANVSGSVTVASGASFEANAGFDGTIFTNAIFISGTGGAAAGYAGNVNTPDGIYNNEPQPLGALDLHGDSTLNGAITLNANSKITHGFNFSTINGNISGAGYNLQLAITVGGQFPLYINGNINLGTGILTISGFPGASYTSLTGSNTLGGVAVLTNSAVFFGTTNAIGGSGQYITINGGGTAALNGSDLRPLLAQTVTNSAGAIAFNGTNSSVNLDFTSYANVSLGSLGNSLYTGVITPGGGDYRLGGGIGTLTVGSTLSGLGIGLIVNGRGTVVLTGTNSFTGATSVANGSLAVGGALQGPLMVQNSGVLLPGPLGGIGSLTVNGPATLTGTVTMTINRSNVPNADLLAANSIYLGGVITITNQGTAPILGDSFQILSVAGTITNGYPAFNLPALTSGLMWDVSNLAVNGKIQVIQATNCVGNTTWPGMLAQQILAAYNDGISNVTIAPGTYYLPDAINQNLNFSQNPDLSFSSLTNFTINASNALFLVGTNIAFAFNNCSNVTLQGATVRTAIIPFTQGRVSNIGVDGNGNADCDWTIDTGFPTNNIYWDLLNAVVGSNATFRVETGDMYNITNYQFLGGQTYLVHFNGSSVNFQSNDWLVARGSAYAQQGSAFYFKGCQNCTFTNLTSQDGGFATFYEVGGGGNHMLGCQIQPSPVPPAGGTQAPVVANAADGLHTIGTYPGMDMENCVFQGVFLDDNIAIHGTYQNVVFSSGNVVVVDGAGTFVAGNPVRFSNTSGFFAQANCLAITNLSGHEVELIIDQAFSVPVGAKVSNPVYNGENYRIINCQIGETRSRGINCKGDNGLISGCTIVDSGSGIQLGPEYSFNESDYVWNTTVTNNTILHCGTAGVYVTYNGAAIGNQNLNLPDNFIQNIILGDSFEFQGCNGLSLLGNTLVNPTAGYNPIWFSQSTNITLAENLVTNAPAGLNLLGFGAGVGGIVNQQNGIYLAGVSYTIINQLSSLVLAGGSTGSQVSQQVGANSSNMYWTLSSLSNGYCAVVCVSNGMVLGAHGSTTSGTPLIMEAYTGADDQLWSLAPITNACIGIMNKLSGMAASVQSSVAGSGLIQLALTNGGNQQWLFLPPAPASVSATPVTGGILLNWSSVLGAGSYNVKRATSANGPFTTIASGITGTGYTDTSGVVGTTYFYEVSAVVGGFETVNSVASTVFMVPVPTWFSFQEANTRLGTNCVTVNTNGFLLATNYFTGNTYIQAANPANNYLHDTNLWVGNVLAPANTNRILLSFDLTPMVNAMAGHTYGISSANLILTHRTPGSGLNSGMAFWTTTPFDETSATWSNPGNGAPPGGTLGTLIINQGMIGTNQYPAVEIYTNAALNSAVAGVMVNPTNETIYFLMKRNSETVGDFNDRFVTETNSDLTYGGVNSRPQLQVETFISGNLPPAPVNLRVTASIGSIQLSWSAVSGAEGYNVLRATGANGPFAIIAAAVSGTTYTDTNVVAGSTYYYEVSAIVGGFITVNSSAATVFVVPTPTWFSLQEGDVRVGTNYSTVNTNGMLVTTNYTTEGTYIQASNPNANYVYNTNLWVGTVQTPPDTNRILLAFDLTPMIGAMAGYSYSITGANLVLTHRTAGDSLNSGMALWVTTPFDDTVATWNDPGAGAPAGGTLGTLIINQGMIGTNQFPTTEVYTNSGLNSAITNALSNLTNNMVYLLIRRNTEAATSFNDRFVTQTNTDPTYGGVDSRPQLQIGITILTNMSPQGRVVIEGPIQPTITAIVVADNSVQITFVGSTNDSSAAFTVQDVGKIEGTFEDIQANVTEIAGGEFKAVLAIGGDQRFYRIRRN